MFFKAIHSILLVLFVLAVVCAGRKLLNGRNAANASVLPFAYFSLSAWILWVLQYGILVAGPFGLVSSEVSRTTSVWAAMTQNVFWIAAILSLHSKHFPKVSLALALLGMISIAVALVTYETPLITSEAFTYIDAVSVATIFTLLAASIWKMPLNKIYPIVFCLHGFSRWVWNYLSFSPSSSFQKNLLYFSAWHAVLMFIWIHLITEMLVRFRVMISSTVEDLGPERAVVAQAVRSLNLDSLRAETVWSLPYTPKALCQLWAEQCHLFILIIGERYGHYVKSMGKSATEFEYDVASEADRKKILVYVKKGVTRDAKLEEFLVRLKDFELGHVIASFATLEDLHEKVQYGVQRWLKSPPNQGDRRDDWSNSEGLQETRPSNSPENQTN